MRKFIFLLLTCLVVNSYGQENYNLNLALNHIKQKADHWGFKTSDINDILISSEITSNGVTYLYLNQAYNKLPVRNAMMTVIIKEGKVLSDAHSFVADIESRVDGNKSATIKADEAILNSAKHLGINIKGIPTLSSRSDNGKMLFSFPEFTKSPIPAELKYEVVGEKIKLVWNLNLDMKMNADYWDLNIDATSGEFISKHNYTLYCQHQHNSFANHDNCSIRTFRKLNDNTKSINEVINATNAAAAKYNVYSLPAESPIHGTRNIVRDDQYPDASPFGWHDTNGIEGPEFTTTRGNNVFAYQDKNDDDNSDGPDTDGGANLNFDFPMDLTKDPRQSADAAVTNLFYMVNMMHDLTHYVGFTEEFGNFQQKNYTNVGDGGDYVLAQAFDGITLHEAGQDLDADGNPTKINNANFSTPPDGFNGRMQMFLWDNRGGAIFINEPESIKGFVEYGVAGFGKPIPTFEEGPITAKVVLVNDGTINSLLGCNPLINKDQVKGNIAMIERGTCQFSRKVKRAQDAGAIAAIICNIAGVNGGDGETADGMASGNDGPNVTIPSVMLKKSDCDKIKLIISNGGTVTITFEDKGELTEYLDGALDNGIIAHEFGHGISNRLTGGPTNTSCLGNNEQMGEGWSDFFSLIMTHETGDLGKDKRGIGNFADAQSASGRGIRRFPYSTDMSLNPQTFDDIKGTSAPHPLGEVWAGMLWDMYWAFIDQYGYNPDWTVKTSGNYKAVFLVMEGMKMQPCGPGFITGRDAIFMADKVHFNSENKCLLWEVFARRGLGFKATGGSAGDRNDGVENFESLPTCIEALKITKTAETSIDAGDELNISLKAINHIPSRQNNVIITDELPDGMTYVSGSSNIAPNVSGNLLTFILGDMEYEREINITYKTKSSPNNKSVTVVKESFDGENNWDVSTNVGSENWFTSFDLYRSFEISYGIFNVAAESDASLLSIPFNITGNNPVMRFFHRFNTEPGNDGGFLEVSVDNGLFRPVTKEKFIRNGYNGPLNYSTLATPNLEAFSGTSGGAWTGDLQGPWMESIVDLSEFKGKSVVFKFRFGSNPTLSAAGNLNGWYIDDFEMLDLYKYESEACIIADGGAKACTNPIETLVNSDGTVNSNDVNENYFMSSLQPNPADEYVILSASTPINTLANIDIIGADGKSVYSSTMQLDNSVQYRTINTNAFPSGFYIVKIQNGNNLTTQKLVIK